MAFLVGGCVRDLLLGIEPKDFDVATDALPEQVRRLFRNCRLVGRRFRLAHVFFGREIIEVATFRAASAPSQGEEPLPDADPEDGEAPELDDLDVIAPTAGAVEADADIDLDDDEDADAEDDEAAGEGDDEENTVADDQREEMAERAGPAERLGSAAHGAGTRVGPPGRAEPPDRTALADRAAPADRDNDRSVARTTGRDAELNDSDSERVTDETGRIIRDNVYGTIDADVWRRDFTCNALYYNIADFSLWDYVGGKEDVAARVLKLIGDPETRFREDPVRMLRGARFEAKLSFTIDPATAEPMARLGELLGGVPPARLFDETLKLFLTGHGARSLEVLRHRGLLSTLLPSVARYFDSHPGSLVEKLVVQGLTNTDTRVLADKPVTPTFLFALLLYGPIAGIIESTPPERWHELGTILDACDRAVREAQTHVAIPKRFTLGVREMFALQPRLEHPRGRRALRVLEHPRFRAAYDLLLLRSDFGLAPREMAQWWTRIQEVSADERAKMADSLAGNVQRSDAPRRGGRRRRRRRHHPGAA